jgi:hypothetical protein
LGDLIIRDGGVDSCGWLSLPESASAGGAAGIIIASATASASKPEKILFN